jgi:diguanylate cyclase (GGDEF)-like protein
MRMKSLRFLNTIFGVSATILIAIVTVSYYTGQRSVDASQWVTRAHEVTSQIEVVHSGVEDIEAGIQAILYTGEVTDLSNFQDALVGLPQQLKNLRRMLVDPRMLQRLDGLELDVRSRLLTAQELQDARRSAGNVGLERAAAIYARENPILAIRRQLTAMENDELRILKERQERADHLRQSTEALLLVLRLVAMANLVLSYFVIKHEYRSVQLRESELDRARVALQTANEGLNHSVLDLARQNEQIESLNRMIELLQRCQQLGEAYEVLANYLPEVAECASGALYLLQPSTQLLERVIAWGSPAEKAEMFASDWCWGLRRGRAHVIHGEVTNPICEHIEVADTGLTVCIPLAAHGDTQGMICLQRARWNPATIKPHLLFMGTAVEQISLGLANLRPRDALRDQSIRDPLTGLFNRRYMEESLEREIARATRSATPVAVLILDLDHFKAINDTCGHAAGDHVLRELGAILRFRSRTEDVAARHGGEEFLLMLPGMDKIDAVQRAEELRIAISEIQLLEDGIDLPKVTVSIGVAVFPDHGYTAEDLLRSVDRALYKAKNAGRDRVALVSARSQMRS